MPQPEIQRFRARLATENCTENARGNLGLYARTLETRHKQPWAFTIHQGPIPTQHLLRNDQLGGARLTRMKESHEV